MDETTVIRQSYPKYNWVDVNKALPAKGLRVLVKCNNHVYIASYFETRMDDLSVSYQFICDYPEKIQFCYPECWLPLPI